MKRISHSYYVVMIDYPNGLGLEAVVQPEMTRRAVVEAIKSGEYSGEIAFIHFIDGLFVEDVTSELIDAAELELKVEYRDHQAAAFDRARALRQEA